MLELTTVPREVGESMIQDMRRGRLPETPRAAQLGPQGMAEFVPALPPELAEGACSDYVPEFITEYGDALTQSDDYSLVAQAIRYLESNFKEQPSLEELAEVLHLSPFHLQRVFTRWAGISPKRFLQFLTIDFAKDLLATSHSVLDTTYAAGLSSPGRLHDLFVSVEAVTPGEYKNQGAGLTIAYGRHATPFGDCLLAATPRGICALNFLDVDNGWEQVVAALYQNWGAATLMEAPDVTAPLAARIFGGEGRGAGATVGDQPPLRLLVKGTNFQVKVWDALLRIPAGEVCTYADIARAIDAPKAARAVGGAVGANAIAFLIPCHRVIRQSGQLSDYRWGATRKHAILGWEVAHTLLDKDSSQA